MRNKCAPGLDRNPAARARWGVGLPGSGRAENQTAAFEEGAALAPGEPCLSRWPGDRPAGRPRRAGGRQRRAVLCYQLRFPRPQVSSTVIAWLGALLGKGPAWTPMAGAAAFSRAPRSTGSRGGQMSQRPGQHGGRAVWLLGLPLGIAGDLGGQSPRPASPCALCCVGCGSLGLGDRLRGPHGGRGGRGGAPGKTEESDVRDTWARRQPCGVCCQRRGRRAEAGGGWCLALPPGVSCSPPPAPAHLVLRLL